MGTLRAENSDPQRLRELAEGREGPGTGEKQGGAESARRELEDLAMRRRKVKDALDQLSDDISEKELMEGAIQSLTDTESTSEEVHRALEAATELVEQVDMANDFLAMGGLDALVGTLRSTRDPGLLDAVSLALGTACANNEVFQEGAAQQGVVADLVHLANSTAMPEHSRRRALYALSSAVRNSGNSQRALEEAEGPAQLGKIAQDRAEGVPLRKKALVLLSDLIASGLTPPSRAWGSGVTRAAADLLFVESLDVQEKALNALLTLLGSTDWHTKQALASDESLEQALTSLGPRLAKWEGEFAADVLELRDAVIAALREEP